MEVDACFRPFKGSKVDPRRLLYVHSQASVRWMRPDGESINTRLMACSQLLLLCYGWREWLQSCAVVSPVEAYGAKPRAKYIYVGKG